jgi:hypothetical protein
MGGADEVLAAVVLGAPNTPGAFVDMGGADEVPVLVSVLLALKLLVVELTVI